MESSISQGYPLFARDPGGRCYAVVGWAMHSAPILIPLGAPPPSGSRGCRSFIPNKGDTYTFSTEPPVWQ